MRLKDHIVHAVAIYAVGMSFYVLGTTRAETAVGDLFWTVGTIYLLAAAFKRYQVWSTPPASVKED